jgi:hypothetical protein
MPRSRKLRKKDCNKGRTVTDYPISTEYHKLDYHVFIRLQLNILLNIYHSVLLNPLQYTEAYVEAKSSVCKGKRTNNGSSFNDPCMPLSYRNKSLRRCFHLTHEGFTRTAEHQVYTVRTSLTRIYRRAVPDALYTSVPNNPGLHFSPWSTNVGLARALNWYGREDGCNNSQLPPLLQPVLNSARFPIYSPIIFMHGVVGLKKGL